MQKYNTYDEFLKDNAIFLKNENNDQLLAAMTKRISNTEKKLQDKILLSIAFKTLDKNPVYAANIISKQYPDCIITLNKLDNPWFEV